MFLLVISWLGVALSCTPSAPRRATDPQGHHREGATNLLPASQSSLPLDPPDFMQIQPQPSRLGFRLEDVRHRLNSRQIEKIQRLKEQLKEEGEQRAKAAGLNKGAKDTTCTIRTWSAATREGRCILLGGFCRITGEQGKGALHSDQVKTCWLKILLLIEVSVFNIDMNSSKIDSNCV